ncbi:MAG TPA: hypothetical protein PKW33_09815 [Anaerolineaceae bacterium]|nr:hypothetical protein [Anaerolineaceae bacterium]HPN51872.1 hypothetical protein [Anaerolineaceae bacterium]
MDSDDRVSISTDERLAALQAEILNLQARVTRLETSTLQVDRLFQPAAGFVLGCILMFVLGMGCLFLFKGRDLTLYLFYFTPMALPFTGFIFDRIPLYAQAGRRAISALTLDAIVTVLALIRSFYALPVISGHAFFLIFALLTVKSNWVRIPVTVVLAEVVYLKAFVWQDPTLLGGALAGGLAAALWWKVRPGQA